jgi:kynurenine formamidase
MVGSFKYGIGTASLPAAHFPLAQRQARESCVWTLPDNPAPQCDAGPDRLDQSERPGALQKSVNRTQRARRREAEDKPAAAILQRVTHQHAGEPGVGVEGAKYLVGKGVVAVGADTWAVEVIPFESKNVFEVHQILLPMSGTYILENMNTAPLAADKAYEFLFVLGTPKITGAVQSIINPVAIR